MGEELFYMVVGIAAILLAVAWISMPFTLLLINAKLARIERRLSDTAAPPLPKGQSGITLPEESKHW